MKHTDVMELERTAEPFVTETKVNLSTRKAKLLYVAKLVAEKASPDDMRLFTIEYLNDISFQQHYDILSKPSTKHNHSFVQGVVDSNVFALIAGDKVLQDAGAGMTVGSQATFLELGIEELHEFSCDCGGEVTKDEMVNRITALANGPANFNPIQQPKPTWVQRIRSIIG